MDNVLKCLEITLEANGQRFVSNFVRNVTYRFMCEFPSMAKEILEVAKRMSVETYDDGHYDYVGEYKLETIYQDFLTEQAKQNDGR